jgi:hypothetical protein
VTAVVERFGIVLCILHSMVVNGGYSDKIPIWFRTSRDVHGAQHEQSIEST